MRYSFFQGRSAGVKRHVAVALAALAGTLVIESIAIASAGSCLKAALLSAGVLVAVVALRH